jgi:hypothetical protein
LSNPRVKKAGEHREDKEGESFVRFGHGVKKETKATGAGSLVVVDFWLLLRLWEKPYSKCLSLRK